PNPLRRVARGRTFCNNVNTRPRGRRDGVAQRRIAAVDAARSRAALRRAARRRLRGTVPARVARLDVRTSTPPTRTGVGRLLCWCLFCRRTAVTWEGGPGGRGARTQRRPRPAAPGQPQARDPDAVPPGRRDPRGRAGPAYRHLPEA